MAGTAWNAGLRPAQRPAGPRRRRPQSPGWLPSRHVPPTDEMAVWPTAQRQERLGAPTGRTGPASGPYARERETSTDDAAPSQRECRGIFCRAWCADGLIMRVSPGGTRHNDPRVTGGSLPSAFTERRHVARTATNGVCHSLGWIPPNAEIPADKGPPRNGESFPPPAFGGLCRPEAGVPSRPRRRAAASRALPATVSMRNAG